MMAREAHETPPRQSAEAKEPDQLWRGMGVPRPTAQFRRRAWLSFQRALDPLGPPRQLRPPRH